MCPFENQKVPENSQTEVTMFLTARRTFLVLVAVSVSTVTLGLAQEKKVIEKKPIQQTSAASGKEMFISYCATCHGKDGKGDGPAAAALKSPPADLTTLAKRHDGKFPEAYVGNTLRSGVSGGAHGSTDMPIWGPLFASVSGRDQAIVNMRIGNLIRYLESIQAK
jgi:mono/diheme cytochrome c family protein